MPVCTPTSVAENAQELGTDLPMRSLSCASAEPLASNAAASATAATDLGLGIGSMNTPLKVCAPPAGKRVAFPEFCAIIGTAR